jgi:hypothetical protein
MPSWGTPFHANMTSCYNGNAATLGDDGDKYVALQQMYFGNMVSLNKVRASIGKGAQDAATRAHAMADSAAETGTSALDSIKQYFNA